MQIKDVVVKHNIRMESFMTHNGGTQEPTKWNIHIRVNHKVETFEYSTGCGLVEKNHYGQKVPKKPKIEEVLYCLVLDSSAANQTFYSWCSDFGYEVDSRKSLDTYLACQKEFEKLINVIGYKAFEELKECQE